jgi:hypothetical protein
VGQYTHHRDCTARRATLRRDPRRIRAPDDRDRRPRTRGPGRGGLLAAFGSLLTGVRDDRRRVRALFIVGLSMSVLQVAFVAFALWGPTQVCVSTSGGPETCQTYWPWEG